MKNLKGFFKPTRFTVAFSLSMTFIIAITMLIISPYLDRNPSNLILDLITVIAIVGMLIARPYFLFFENDFVFANFNTPLTAILIMAFLPVYFYILTTVLNWIRHKIFN